jgi:hypothetical protein
MARSKNHIFRPIYEQDAELLRRARESIEKAKGVLALPVPSTFLGTREVPPPDRTEDKA